MKLKSQNRKLYAILTVIMLLAFFDGKAQTPIKAWTKTKKNFGYSYIPKNLKTNEVFKINIISPKKIDKQAVKDYVMTIAKGFSNKLGTPKREWKIYQNTDKEFYSINSFQNGKTITNIRLQTIKTSKGIVMVVMLYKPKRVYEKYKSTLHKIVEDAKISFLGKNTQNSKSPKNEIRTNKKPKFKTINIPGLKMVMAAFYTVDYDPMTDSYGVPKEDVILEFKDGTVSKDVKTILQKGISASKKKYPKKWGVARFRNGKYEVKWSTKKKYKVYESITKYTSDYKNKKISGCWSTSYAYTQQTPTTGEHKTSLISYDYCFDNKGRFSKGEAVGTVNKQTSGGSGKEFSAGGSSSSNKRGWYYIDGNIIQLIYDNGKTEMFFINLKDKKQNKNYYLRLNNKMYFKKK